MPVSVVLTLIGDDRPGLVESVSEVLAAHGANWEQSRMASLAGKFAGIPTLHRVFPDAGTRIATDILAKSILGTETRKSV